MTPEPGPQVREKVYAYVTQGEQVLVFRHVDVPDAGVQVPGGTVKPGESLREAVLREAFEETGVADLEIVAELGDTWVGPDATGQPGAVHRRHFFQLRAATPLPATWRHEERDPSDGGPSYLFEFSWLPLAGASELLIADLGVLVHLAQVPPGKQSCPHAAGAPPPAAREAPGSGNLAPAIRPC